MGNNAFGNTIYLAWLCSLQKICLDLK